MTTKFANVRQQKSQRAPFTNATDIFRLHLVLSDAVRMTGRRMEEKHGEVWESRSLRGDHLWSANDLEATAFIIRHVVELLAKYDPTVDVGFLTEELSLVPHAPHSGGGVSYSVNGRRLYLHIDPIDGSKAFDNWKGAEGDCPVPRPGSAISIAAVCPVEGETLVSALYCFDLGEVFTSVYLGRDAKGQVRYASLREGTLLRPLAATQTGETRLEAKQRILCGNYNSKALVEIASLEQALMERGLKSAYGGLSGSTATDVVNTVRGSFAACLDIRALCQQGGSVPYWYDGAGAFPIAAGRGLSVIVTDAQGKALRGANHYIYTPIAFVVARPEVKELVVDAIRSTLCPSFPAEESVYSAVSAKSSLF